MRPQHGTYCKQLLLRSACRVANRASGDHQKGSPSALCFLMKYSWNNLPAASVRWDVYQSLH